MSHQTCIKTIFFLICFFHFQNLFSQSSIKFYTAGQDYGVADLDCFWISSQKDINVSCEFREMEEPADYTVGGRIPRSKASKEVVWGNFGCNSSSPYQAKSGYVQYNSIMCEGQQNILIRYSRKHHLSGIPIDIYINNVKQGSFTPINTGDWNNFTETEWLPLTFPPLERISTPSTPTGSSTGKINQNLSFTSSGATSDSGHTIEYQFDWGDGSQSSWGASTQNHSYNSPGTKSVKARARCQTHISIVSSWSNSKSISISYCTLTININPQGAGNVSKSPDKVNFNYDEVVQLTANENSVYQFDHWGGDLNGSTNPQSLTMNDDKNVTAYFTQVQETISTPDTPSSQSTGKVLQNLSFSTSGSNSNLGHSVEYQFDWGDGTQSSWGASTQNHSYNSSGTKSVKARARCQNHTSVVSSWSSTMSISISYCTLSININPPDAGTLIKSPNKTNYNYDEIVQLTANANLNYRFDHWGADLNGSTNPKNITMNGDKNVSVYFDPNTNVEIESKNKENVKEFSLEQNFPNPFNPETTIRFRLPRPCNVSLKIFNISGQLIETLINRNLAAGIYDVKWQSKGLSNGIYLYMLRADEFTETKKFILQN